MMSFLRKYEIWVFLCLIIVANTLFVSGIVFDILPKSLYAYGRFALLGILLLAVVIVCRGRVGVDDLVRPMLAWRRHVGWYLFVILWTPIVIMAVLLARWALGAEVPEFNADFSVVTKPTVMLVLFFSSFVGEMVWISYSVRRLTMQFTPYVAALIANRL